MEKDNRGLAALLNRARTWPKGAQEEAEKALREIEEDFIIGPATRTQLDRAHQEVLRGEGTDMEELFARYDL
jgi:hypothetical protein